jgi:hypothetical protein
LNNRVNPLEQERKSLTKKIRFRIMVGANDIPFLSH